MPKPFSLLFVLVLCMAGYYLLNSIHRYHYFLKRSNGYHTFLISAIAGFSVCGLSVVVYAIFDLILCLLSRSFSLGDFVLNEILNLNSSHIGATLFDLCAISVAICIATPLITYRFDPDYKDYVFLEEFAEDGESPEFNQLFFRSYEFALPILFTMSDRKVYIGYVTEIYAKPFNDVHILPLLSGYRESSTLKLNLVTPYKDILHDVEDETIKEVNLEAFTVTLPLREIVHAHLHDLEKYPDFKKAEKNADFTQGDSYYFSNDV
ncbi:hypothetical protein [Vibrio sonorensis]|uniref:hypothetical protein n=1 Tax=Vibrio sonorensis TaxID=1004316 RepID=UPI0008DAF29B|nr:hypothetical protein [Vibrio sonorensis]